MTMIEVTQGSGPLVLGLPHSGTELPSDIADGLNDRGRALADTDWHVHDLYAGLVADVTSVRTSIHRYAIDVNRNPDGTSLYPGQNTTGLCPLTDFEGKPIYRHGKQPHAQEIARRRALYHAPYHAALAQQCDRVRKLHGFAILYDCHSIRSRIPYLFAGTLPDFNIGSDDGKTCAPSIETEVLAICQSATDYSSVVNARFKGGWTTRHYGRPNDGIHAIQMELAQSTYMLEQPPWTYDKHRAKQLRGHLKSILATLMEWRPT